MPNLVLLGRVYNKAGCDAFLNDLRKSGRQEVRQQMQTMLEILCMPAVRGSLDSEVLSRFNAPIIASPPLTTSGGD